MATEKTLVINTEIKGTDKLSNNLEKVNQDVVKLSVSAQEIMQTYVTRIPEIVTKTIPNLSKIIPVLEEIDKMNKDTFASSMTLNANRLKQIESEITSLKKMPHSIIEINKAYAAKEKLIIQQSEFTRVKMEEEIAALEAKKVNHVIIEETKADKIREIDAKLKTDLEKNAADIRAAWEKSLEPIKDSKGIIDIDATKENIEQVVDGLKKYKTDVLIIQNAVANSYNLMIEAAGEDKEKVAQLTKEKEAALKSYADQVKGIEKDITETQEKENNLRLQQWQGYAANVQKMIGELKGVTDKTSEYFGSAFGAISNVYKAEINAINEETKALDYDLKEISTKEFDRKERLEEYNKQLAEAQKGTNQELITDLENRVQQEVNLENELKEEKKNIDKEKEKLDNEKKKKEVEQEKIEKLKRKADLIKSIGEATANVAQGVTKALAFGPFIGPVLAGIVAAAGVVQIGIMTKQLAKFEDGGLLKGKRHSQGGMRIEGTNIEVEGGEYVVNRESTSKNIGLVRYINSQRKELTPTDINAYFSHASKGYEPPFSRMFESGGEIPKAEVQRENDNKALLEAIKNIKIEPKVAVTDIHRVQDEMINVSGWSGM